MEKGFDYKTNTLDSGLRLVTIPMPGTKAVTILVLVGTGSKYETKNINGISHFLEHMMFKGTEKRPGALDIAKQLEGIGASYNAFTGQEYTGYYAKSSGDKLDVILDVISDIFLNSKLEEKEINMERGVIFEEINMYRDNPSRYVGNLYTKLLYGDQPAGWDIAGEKEILAKLKRDDFVNYFRTHYIAENTIIAVAGNVDSEEVLAKVNQKFEKIRQGAPFTKLITKEEQKDPQLLVHFKETDQVHFVLGFRSFDMFNDKKYALGVLANVLGGGMSSRLFSEVREKRGLAYYVGAGDSAQTDVGSFAVKAGVNKERTNEAVEVILSELAKARDRGITEEELQSSKDQMKGELALFLEHSDNVAETYADSMLFHNKILTPEEEYGKISKLTLAQVNQAGQEIFKKETLNLALIGPFKEADQFQKLLTI